jgi:hydroxyisourate hydrolase
MSEPTQPSEPSAGVATGDARLTTHVLDTAAGVPAAGVAISVHRLLEGTEPVLVAEATTNADGRTDSPLLEGEELSAGTYEIVFAVGAYFTSAHLDTTSPPFLDRVPVRFGTDGTSHLHVPLLVTPWSYSTYRGS